MYRVLFSMPRMLRVVALRVPVLVARCAPMLCPCHDPARCARAKARAFPFWEGPRRESCVVGFSGRESSSLSLPCRVLAPVYKNYSLADAVFDHAV